MADLWKTSYIIILCLTESSFNSTEIPIEHVLQGADGTIRWDVPNVLMVHGVVKTGAYRYQDGSQYVGDWNQRGQKHGMGHLSLPDGTRYDGSFQNGLCAGLGVICFPDGAKYEGEFMQGWFHGHGVFWRSDGMKFEGEFRGGRIWGLGLVTFSDNSHGFPRNEGFFQDCRIVRKKRCPEVVQRAQKVAFMARVQCD